MKHALDDSTGATVPTHPAGGSTAGVDWARDDHVVAMVDSAGRVSDRFTIAHTGVGLTELRTRLRRLGVAEVAIERPDGPVVDTLLQAGFTVVVISPNELVNISVCEGAGG